MRSKAQFKNHPLHPILIPFPIAFLIGGTVADVVGRIGGLSGWPMAASYLLLAGVATALVAAIPFLAEASIGHELTADALVIGFAAAVKAYKAALAGP